MVVSPLALSGEAGQLDVVGSILPRVDSVARPAEVIVEYDDLAPLTSTNFLAATGLAVTGRVSGG